MYLDKKRYAATGKMSFIYYDVTLAKNVRLREDEIPSWVQAEEDADRFCRMKEAEGESSKLRAKRREEWKTKYYKFDELLEKYRVDRKGKAPNSWENDCYYLRQYAFHFFLTERACNNLNNWPTLFEDFCNWLKSVKPIKGPKPTLAVSTQNHCIKSLNTFLAFMQRTNQMSATAKCKMFSKADIHRKDFESVISERDEALIFQALSLESRAMAYKFKVALATGLRDSELAGLSLGDISRGEPPQEQIRKLLRKNSMECLAYITLKDQVVDSDHPRDTEGNVLRKPLKHRKKIGSGDNRIIPIESPEIFKILVYLFKEQQERFAQRINGENRRNYLFFEGITTGTYRNALMRAAGKTKVKYHSPHDCRHTFATRLAGRIGGDYMLCRLILGHKDMETTEGYLHIFQQMQSDLENQRAIEEGLDFQG